MRSKTLRTRSARASLAGAAAAAILVLAAGAAEACRCVKRPLRTMAAGADAIVLAEVVGLAGNIDAEGGAVATLRPSSAWKRAVPGAVAVQTQTSCAFDFKVGATYLVFLTAQRGRAPYATTQCDGNQPGGEAGAAVEWLGRNVPPRPVGP